MADYRVTGKLPRARLVTYARTPRSVLQIWWNISIVSMLLLLFWMLTISDGIFSDGFSNFDDEEDGEGYPRTDRITFINISYPRSSNNKNSMMVFRFLPLRPPSRSNFQTETIINPPLRHTR